MTPVNQTKQEMINCELCKLKARTYCESDQACLCWDCDAKVHAANFLVARHSRSLLCHVCNALTPWKASGEKLGHTVSVCESCVNGQQEEEDESEEINEDDDDDDDYSDEIEEDGGENQVVPWSTVTTSPPPASSSSSSSEEMSESGNFFSLKRRREDASDLQSQDEEDGSWSARKYGKKLKVEAASVESTKTVRPRSAAVIGEPLRRLRRKRDIREELSDEDSWRSCSRPI